MKYYINTRGDVILLYSEHGAPIDNNLRLVYMMKECDFFTYYLYKYTRINLLAENKFYWVERYWNYVWHTLLG